MKRQVAMGLAASLCFIAASVPAATPDDLLRQVQDSSRAAAKVNQEREQRFVRNRNEQAELLRQAEAELAAAQARADRVKAQCEQRQKEIAELKGRIDGRSGELAQVFATARQFAADFRAMAADSLVTAQFPGRLEFLGRIATAPAVPGIDELEALWLNLHEEVTENGKVARFSAEIVDTQGAKRKAEVVRVGPFTAFADGAFLAMPSGTAQLVALTPQPERGLRKLAGEFAQRRDGLAPVLVDASRGGLIAIEAQKPSLVERIEQGGAVGYVIMAIGAVGLLIALFQSIYLWFVGGRMERQLDDIHHPSASNPLGRVLSVYRQARDAEDAEMLELHLSEAVLKETPRLERFQSALRLFTAVAPLLGLLGTVTGMIVTFQAITAFGTGDPKLMAGGISQALVTTVQGLVVAIPILFLNTLLSARSRALVQILDEQSAGLIARRMESPRA
ncbi:MAG: MotA/TolQ/ExbB proton channel family protein [Gammaproteobacteria bacterium]|nr:MotA/TolQ/ExbB proton channel family protein [Gammaproteobacteria bacterium]